MLWQFDIVTLQDLINSIVDKQVSLCLFITKISFEMKQIPFDVSFRE